MMHFVLSFCRRYTEPARCVDWLYTSHVQRNDDNNVLELVALYPDRAELKTEFPELEDEDIQQALMYAASNLDDQILELEPHAAAA